MVQQRSLVLLAKKPPADLRERIAAGEEPRPEYLELAERLDAELVDFHDVERSTHPVVRFFARRFGPSWGLAALGVLRRREFDDLYATGEDVGLPLAMMLRAVRSYGKLTLVVHNVGTPRRRKLFRLLGHRVYRYVICLGSEQVRILTEEVGLPQHKVKHIYYWLDHAFYQPCPSPTEDFVLCVGMESRDYETLQKAAAGLPYRFHVIASGWSPGPGYAAADGIRQGQNVVVERGVSTTRLRDLYGNCRFVVVPLRSVSHAAGVTSTIEAMAMGKPVIVTDSPGIRDYVVDGVSGRVVPVGDPAALREAIAGLWNDPAALRRIGSHNRRWIETTMNTERYVEQVARLLNSAA